MDMQFPFPVNPAEQNDQLCWWFRSNAKFMPHRHCTGTQGKPGKYDKSLKCRNVTTFFHPGGN